MTTANKKLVPISLLLSLTMLFVAPAFAQGTPANCDVDGDGYITLSAPGAEVILGDQFNADGDYNAEQWSNFYTTFKNDPDAETLCNALNFKKGAEPVRCDAITVSETSGVYDPAQASAVSGSSVYPGAFDTPNDGIDQDCDGADGELITATGNGAETLGNLGTRVTKLLSNAVIVISVVFLLWGGIMYTTAAGDEAKTRKARKAMIGAVIGLVVGLLAPMVVDFIVSSLA